VLGRDRAPRLAPVAVHAPEARRTAEPPRACGRPGNLTPETCAVRLVAAAVGGAGCSWPVPATPLPVISLVAGAIRLLPARDLAEAEGRCSAH
jgi:hypothetical protein